MRRSLRKGCSSRFALRPELGLFGNDLAFRRPYGPSVNPLRTAENTNLIAPALALELPPKENALPLVRIDMNRLAKAGGCPRSPPTPKRRATTTWTPAASRARVWPRSRAAYERPGDHMVSQAALECAPTTPIWPKADPEEDSKDPARVATGWF